MRWLALPTLLILAAALGCPPPPPPDDDDDGSSGSHACESEVPGFPEYCVMVTDRAECPASDDTKTLHEDTDCADLGYTWECPSGVWVVQGGSCL
jgi:hypothetical protein